MVYMNVFYVLVALLLALATGGTPKNILVLLCYCKLADGFLILEMKKQKKGSTISKILSNFIGATPL